jgi:hypothetical protein
VSADFDKDTAMLDALAYLKAARANAIPAALEVSQSGRGAHVWIFFAHPVQAARPSDCDEPARRSDRVARQHEPDQL